MATTSNGERLRQRATVSDIGDFTNSEHSQMDPPLPSKESYISREIDNLKYLIKNILCMIVISTIDSHIALHDTWGLSVTIHRKIPLISGFLLRVIAEHESSI